MATVDELEVLLDAYRAAEAEVTYAEHDVFFVVDGAVVAGSKRTQSHVTVTEAKDADLLAAQLNEVIALARKNELARAYGNLESARHAFESALLARSTRKAA